MVLRARDFLGHSVRLPILLDEDHVGVGVMMVVSRLQGCDVRIDTC